MTFQGFDGKAYLVIELKRRHGVWLVSYRVPGLPEPIVAYLTTTQKNERLTLN